MKNLSLLLFSLVYLLIVLGCTRSSDKISDEGSKPKQYSIKLGNRTLGCMHVIIEDSSGVILDVKESDQSTSTDSITTKADSVTIALSFNTQYWNGGGFSISDGSGNILGQSDLRYGIVKIRLPEDQKIGIGADTYDPCAFPDEPGCPVTPTPCD